MGTSDANKVSFKRREELDVLLDGFERDLSRRVDELTDYCNGYANSILSVTEPSDDQYVSDRIQAILQQRGLEFALPVSSEP